MQIAELRQRITEKIGLVAAEGDKESVDAVLAYARAVLVAVARHPGDKDVALLDFVVDTRTAALILGLHPEYVRSLVRPRGSPGGYQGGRGVQDSAVTHSPIYGYGNEVSQGSVRFLYPVPGFASSIVCHNTLAAA